jgi:chloramphenicol-sensitive protein RarD
MNPGILYATLAYAAWGLFPLYFHHLSHVPALEMVLHRTLWSLVFVLLLLAVLKRWSWIRALRGQPKVLGAFALSAVLLSGNWLVYVWAVQHQHVVDASLGYFILPLVSMALGCVFLGERPRPGQWLAMAAAAGGVVWLTVQTGHLPWISLALALTFGFYGLLRKVASLGALEGLALETMLLAPAAAVLLGWMNWRGQGTLVQGDTGTMALLVFAGPMTAVPLLLFAAGARRISMGTMGILQYISPSLQFATGVWLFGEPFQLSRLAGFAMIWAALVVYSLEGWWTSRRTIAT